MSWGLAEPFFTGTLTVSELSRYDVAIAGREYAVDWGREEQFRHESVPLLREQIDQGERPGEQSLNPAGLWRRATESWHLGAGQSWLDRAGTNPFRFNTSKGVDPWTEYELSLLPGTTLADSATGTNQYLAASGGRLYASDGNAVNATGVGDETFAACTGTPAAAVTSLTSDGAACYAGFGASGIYTATGTVFASFVTGTVNLVRYVKGRLMAATGPNLYNPTAAGALPTALYTHPNSSWAWTDMTEGPGHIYAAGFAGDKSMIYKTEVKADGTALDIPVVAAVLPDGEIARSLTGYLWYLVIGTNLGLRFAVPDGDGHLNMGRLIPTDNPVLCGEGQNRFVWYGLTNYDATSTGLGRVDLANFTADLTPAYATDLMATAQGDVQAVATYNSKRWFTVSGAGVFKQSASKVASGSLSGGRLAFGIPDSKNARQVNVRHNELAAGQSVEVTVATDGNTTTSVGTSDAVGSTQPEDPFELNNVSGHDFEWSVTISGDTKVRSVWLEADPVPSSRTTFIFVPLLLRDRVDIAGVDVPVDVSGERAYLNGLRDSRRVVTYQEGSESLRVVVEDTQWFPWRKTGDRAAYQGTFLVKLKAV